MMHRVNLLRYFDKSFSEIYQIEHGEVVPEAEDLTVVTGDEDAPEHIVKKQGISKSKFLKIFIYIISLLLVILSVIGGFVYYKIKSIEKEIANKNKLKEEVKKQSDSVKHEAVPKDNGNNKEDNLDGLLDESLKEFKQIGSIQFIEDITVNKLSETDQQIDKKTDNVEPMRDEKIKKKNNVKSNENAFAIIIDEIYLEEINRLKKFISEFNVSFQTNLKGKEKKTLYKAYRYVEKSSTYLGEKPVELLAVFYNKDEAVSFLRTISQKGVITSKVEDTYIYEVTISTFKSEEDLSNFINKANLKNKKYSVKNLNIDK